MAATHHLYDFRNEDRIGVFRLLDRIEVFEAEEIRKAVYEIVEREALQGLVFSFADVPYVDSSGVGVFVNLQYQIGQRLPIRMCEVADPIRDVLTFTNLISRFAIDASEADSIRRIQQG